MYGLYDDTIYNRRETMTRSLNIERRENRYIFLTTDPVIKILHRKVTDTSVELKYNYDFTTNILVAFVFDKNEDGTYKQYYYNVFDVVEIPEEKSYKSNVIDVFIEHRRVVYNGTYINLI